MAGGLPAIPSPTISATTGDRPVASGFAPAPTGFVSSTKTRPSTPTESSSRRTASGAALCYGLVVLVALLSTSCCHDAVTLRYLTVLHRKEADSHRSVFPPSQAHVAVVALRQLRPRSAGGPEWALERPKSLASSLRR